MDRITDQSGDLWAGMQFLFLRLFESRDRNVTVDMNSQVHDVVRDCGIVLSEREISRFVTELAGCRGRRRSRFALDLLSVTQVRQVLLHLVMAFRDVRADVLDRRPSPELVGT